MISDLIRGLGEDVGVALPEVRAIGEDPVLPSVFMLGTAAAASVGALTAAVAVFWDRQRETSRPATPGSASPDLLSSVRGDLAGGVPDHGTAGVVDSTDHGTDSVADHVTDHPAAGVSVALRHAVVAFQSERHFRIDGEAPCLWAPLSGDYRTADGWVRLHCNFDHHRDAALRALGLADGTDRACLAEVCARRTGAEVEEAVTREGGCAAAMRSRAEWLSHPQGRAVAALPLVGLSRLDHSRSGDDPGSSGSTGSESHGHVWPVRGARPLQGVRVLDLTRVIAGPVAGRTLAAHGADVLRVGAAHLPEVPGLVVETAFGKRSCDIDVRTEPEALRELVREADVVVQAYRPGAIAARGFGPEGLAMLRPGIVCVEISAYGSRGPWASRRGFDSLVQMACGLAHEGGDGTRPHPLPIQALDHATGYLAAFGAIAALLRRTEEGGSWHVELSLARTAKWLDDLGRVDGADTPEPSTMPAPSTAGLLATMASRFGTLTYVKPPGMIDGAEPYYASPPPRRGEDPRAWLSARSSGRVNGVSESR